MQMDYLVLARLSTLTLGAAIALSAVSSTLSCSATDGTTFGDGGGTTSSSSGHGGSGGLGLNTGGAHEGGGAVCTDPTCIGNTPQGECDQGLAIDSADPMDGARAIGLCQQASPDTWGVVSAAYVVADGSPMSNPALAVGHGILGGFGPAVHPREGANMLALSSGAARQPTDPGYSSVGGDWKDMSPHNPPVGYPKESPSCPGVTTGEPYDSAGLEVVVKTPTDALSFSFNLDFYTYEFPNYICSTFNDFFVALLQPVPQGLVDGNISFDSQGNLISVNAGFLEVCYPQQAGGKNFACAYGPGELAGTGFDEQPNGSAATSWLETTAPVEAPGSEITLRFAIWDSGDGILDSSVLVDNFRFKTEAGTTGTVPVPK